jgi:hypothetical protein
LSKVTQAVNIINKFLFSILLSYGPETEMETTELAEEQLSEAPNEEMSESRE